jgi:signal transduction histidine kinase
MATGLRREWPDRVAVVAAVGVGAASAYELLTSPLSAGQRTELVLITVLGGYGFVGAGLRTRRHRPGSRVGVLMLTFGLAWLIGGLRWSDGGQVAVTVGTLGGWVWGAVLAQLLLSFPDGRLKGRVDRGLVFAAWGIATVGRWVWIVLADQHAILADLPNRALDECAECVTTFVARGFAPSLALALSTAENAATAVVALAICVRLAWRWYTASGAQRYALAPVAGVNLAITIVVAASTGVAAFGLREAGRELSWLWDACIIVFPFAFLGGVLRTRLQHAAALAGVLDALTTADGADGVEEVLRRELRDDTMQVLYWLPAAGHFVDAAGVVCAPPDAGEHRAITPVELEGRRVAALVHDPSLSDDASVRASGQTAALWLDRARLEAQRNAHVIELRDSRARVVVAADEERRRIERDLHDGAQQRLAGLLLQSRLRRRDLAQIDGSTEQLIEELEDGLASALAELRALAAGILPPVLTDHGLAAAVEDLAASCPVPVAVECRVAQRPPGPIESAAYFVVAEALANVIKHSRADHAAVQVVSSDGCLTVQVTDNGVGGAGSNGGTGLRGLTDRVAALDGTLRWESAPETGTRLRAEIPCAP